MSTVTFEQAMEMARQRHLGGQLAEAEQIYRRILAADPQQSDALEGLGIVAYQAGRKDAALQLIDRAIAIHPQVSQYHCNRGMVLASLGRLAEAIAAYRAALALRQDYAQVHNNLGNALQAVGQSDEAMAEFQAALAVQPDYAEAHNNLGNVLLGRGKWVEAMASYRKAVALRPDFAEAHNNLGNALRGAGQIDEAIASYRRALELRPNYAAALCNLGYALRVAGHGTEAEGAYRQTLALEPDFIEAFNGLGNVLLMQQKFGDAIGMYRQALARQPQHVETLYNLGIALHADDRLVEAIDAFRAALVRRPAYVEAINNLALALQAKGELEEATGLFRQAISLRPDFVEPYNNLGNALKDVGRIEDAMAAYEKAAQTDPGFVQSESNRIFAMQYSGRWDRGDIFGQASRWSALHAQPLAGEVRAHDNDRSPSRRLRIGYVSPDFRNHAQSLLTIPLLSRHDHGPFEVYCYANVPRPDPLTQRIRACADVWRSTVGLSDAQVAQMVKEDKIDILIDLTMHMAHGRLLLFARKPAPVQITWLAYPGTTGLRTIDYRLTDPYLDPPGLNDAYYSEQSIRLPDTFWCYDPLTREPAVNELPAAKSGQVTFGCLNNFCKVSEGTLGLWSKVLAGAADSRLILMCPRGSHRQGVLAKLGVGEDRVEFVEFAPREQYLRTYHRIDIGLDTLPYNGHTTSLDSLWMGVPVITLVGQTVVGRAGWSQLCNLNLKELAARSEEQFVKLAVGLAGDLPRLAQLRATLRGRMEKSPLMDGERFARNIESTYRNLWRRWCQTKS
jgi:predicted O-linked N-acetylglucosamine transferase (SPINDLY family)